MLKGIKVVSLHGGKR